MRVALLALLVVAPAAAMPRFAVREGKPCVACHVDPTGGGMRRAFGSGYFQTTRLPVPEWAAATGPADPHLSDSVSIGGDVRALYQHLRKSGADQPQIDSFYLMEGATYLAAKLGGPATLYLAPWFHGEDGLVLEAFGLLRFESLAALYVKVGRFLPPFGWKQPDHSVFVRKQLGFGPTTRETGVEIGVDPGDFSLSVAVFNGLTEEAASAWDDNLDKGLSGRLAWRYPGRWLRLELGLSGLYNQSGLGKEDHPAGIDARVEDLRAGAFAGLSLGRFAWLGEAAVRRVDDRQESAAVTALASYQELAFMAWQGLELVLTYELWDQDTEVTGDAAHRLGWGLDFYPWTGVELSLRHREILADEKHRLSDIREVAAVLHFFF